MPPKSGRGTPYVRLAWPQVDPYASKLDEAGVIVYRVPTHEGNPEFYVSQKTIDFWRGCKRLLLIHNPVGVARTILNTAETEAIYKLLARASKDFDMRAAYDCSARMGGWDAVWPFLAECLEEALSGG